MIWFCNRRSCMTQVSEMVFLCHYLLFYLVLHIPQSVSFRKSVLKAFEAHGGTPAPNSDVFVLKLLPKGIYEWHAVELDEAQVPPVRNAILQLNSKDIFFMLMIHFRVFRVWIFAACPRGLCTPPWPLVAKKYSSLAGSILPCLTSVCKTVGFSTFPARSGSRCISKRLTGARRLRTTVE